MTSVNAGALGTYGYNGDGQRVKKVEGGATTYYVYSAVPGSAAFELNGSGVVNRVHVTAGGKEIAQLATDGGFYWLHTDHLGTPRRMTNSTGTVMFRGEYDPHGNPLLEWTTISNGKFTGYERDAVAGLDFAQARHYKYGRGRFMQPDPVRSDKLNGINRYTSVYNDPINFVDLDGRDPIPAGGPINLYPGWTPPSIFPSNAYYGLEQARQSCVRNGGVPRLSYSFDGAGRVVPLFGCDVPPPTFDASIIFRSARDEIRSDSKTTFSSYGIATIAYPDSSYCEIGSTRTVIVEFGFNDVKEIRPLPENIGVNANNSQVRADGNIRLLNVKMDIDYSVGKGQITIEIDFVRALPATDTARISITIIGERKETRHLGTYLSEKGVVALECKK